MKKYNQFVQLIKKQKTGFLIDCMKYPTKYMNYIHIALIKNEVDKRIK